ncbi:LVIVD repeat-containing protein [Hoyosella subflava]|uniref:Uncharacterized protein n=1 Tax=Hoyosella subflava (strain DSM 45089 / JCM 17490 / NBRC 109087 / DQS3-9A1) TaxID=443218 RepID=F6EK21_HOYSD|nr:hypothetical protein [Hoyosella subflava]AEF41379.1 hypothetical protein AS9A_2932 [Hoyosella subflava DQS3-9A1]
MGEPTRSQSRSVLRAGASACALALIVAGAPASADPVDDFLELHRTAVERADCGPGSDPEPGLQGQVPGPDRDSGRSAQGYNCNLSLVGQHQGPGAGIVSVTYDHCSYTGSNIPIPEEVGSPGTGVQVIDASDPANPRHVRSLQEPPMLAGTWESLDVHEGRGLLAGTGVGILVGAGGFSIYDVSEDCANPRLLNHRDGTQLSMPLPITTHEGAFSPDGQTYWAAGTVGGQLSAIDVSDPANPRVIWTGITGISNHGFGITADGNRMYISTLAGITVLDVSSVQRRDPFPVVPHVGRLFWSDGQLTQHTIPVTVDGAPVLFTVDEGGSGGVKIIDSRDDQNLKLINTIKLEVNLPENLGSWARDNAGNGAFGYDAHYCTVDRKVDPTALACGWVQSGIRVFDVRDLNNVKEIAYFNPPAQVGKAGQLVNSTHATLGAIVGLPLIGSIAVARAIADGDVELQDIESPRARLLGIDMSADWCMSPPAFHGNQLWVTCMDNGFMALQFENGVYPIS